MREIEAGTPERCKLNSRLRGNDDQSQTYSLTQQYRLAASFDGILSILRASIPPDAVQDITIGFVADGMNTRPCRASWLLPRDCTDFIEVAADVSQRDRLKQRRSPASGNQCAFHFGFIVRSEHGQARDLF